MSSGPRSFADQAICAARSAWYATERPRLWKARATADASYATGDPLISVIVPTHNRVELLMSRALPSVLAQTYQNFEVLVCAHGCTDDTRARVLSAAVKDAFELNAGSRIRLIEVPRLRRYPPTVENHWLAGPVDPINAGLRHASGHWIARLDDDDAWRPEHLEQLLRYAQHKGLEFVSAAYAVHQNGRERVVWDDGGNPPIGGVQTWLYRSYLRFMRANPDCWRKARDRVNDTDLAQRFRNAGVRLGHLSMVTCDIRPRPGESEIGLAAYKADVTNKTEWAGF